MYIGARHNTADGPRVDWVKAGPVVGRDPIAMIRETLCTQRTHWTDVAAGDSDYGGQEAEGGTSELPKEAHGARFARVRLARPGHSLRFEFSQPSLRASADK